MLRARTALLAALVVAGFMPPPRPVVAASPSPPLPAGALLELADVGHALQERQLIITGWIRNAGPLSVSGLVIDASGFAPAGDLAAFGSDGVPWSVRPGTAEHFQIFLPLGPRLVSTYTVTISSSRPRQARPASLTRGIFPAFYRPLILPRVKVAVEGNATTLTFRATADDLPVAAVLVTVNLLVRERGETVLRVLTVEVPVDRPLRLRFAPLIIRVVSVTVTEVTLSSTWALP